MPNDIAHPAWHECDADRVAGEVIARAREIEQAYAERYSSVETAYDLYHASHESGDPGDRVDDLLGANILAEATDALAAELTQDPVRTATLAVGLDYDRRNKVRQTQWYLDAAYQEHRMPEMQYLVVRDSVIAGTGYGVVLDGDDGPSPERVHPLDVLVDDAGCSGRVEPPELIIRRRLPRRRAQQLYPELADRIADAPRPRLESKRDVVTAFLAWYDAGPDETGRFVVAIDGIEGQAAVDEEWEGRPPWFYVRIIPPLTGLAGISSLLRATSLQAEHDRLSGRLQDAMTYATPRLFYQRNAIDEKALETEYGTAVPCNVPPQQAIYMHTPAAVNPEIYAQLDRLRAAIFRIMQANETFAAGEVPSHLKSGVAVMNYREVRNRRLLAAQREIEWCAVRLSEELLRAEARASDSGAHRVRLLRSGTLREVPFSDVVSDLDSIQLRAQPISAFAATVSGRIELLQGLYSEALISAEDFHAMTTDITDLETVRRRITASRDAIEDTIDRILSTGEVQMPESYLDLKLAMRVGRDALLRAQLDDVSEERLAALRKWLSIVGAKLAENAAPPPAAPMPPGNGAGMPMPPPGAMSS